MLTPFNLTRPKPRLRPGAELHTCFHSGNDVGDFERERHATRDYLLRDTGSALEAAGIEFVAADQAVGRDDSAQA